MWRCANCNSLHCLESIDFAHYYANYPIRLQKYDFFARHIFERRLQFMLDAGLGQGDTLLDYGCGSGYFDYEKYQKIQTRCRSSRIGCCM